MVDKYKNQIDGNITIAQFDGWYINPDVNKGSDICWFHKDYSTKLTNTLFIPSKPSNFKYHLSWDWLMPVIEKIERLELSEGHSPIVTIETGYTVISDNGESPIIENQYKIKIESVWKAIVDFIHWYNNYKKELI